MKARPVQRPDCVGVSSITAGGSKCPNSARSNRVKPQASSGLRQSLKAKYLQLVDAGKPAKVALTAIMRKLVVLAISKPIADGNQNTLLIKTDTLGTEVIVTSSPQERRPQSRATALKTVDPTCLARLSRLLRP